MKKLIGILFLLGLELTMSHIAEAVPVQYEFSGTISSLYTDGWIADNIHSNSFTGSFIYNYDPNVPVSPYTNEYMMEGTQLQIKFDGFTLDYGLNNKALRIFYGGIGWDPSPPQGVDYFAFYNMYPMVSFDNPSVPPASTPGAYFEDFGGSFSFLPTQTYPDYLDPVAFIGGNIFLSGYGGYGGPGAPTHYELHLNGTIDEFASVPEPPTILLLGIGLLGCGWLLIRKRLKNNSEH
jgi:hypothetical protein